MHAHIWENPEIYQIWTLTQANQNDRPKKNQSGAPQKWFKLPQGQDSGTFSLSSPLCLSTHMNFFHLVNTLLGSLLSIFVEKIFYKAEKPGPLSLTASLWLGFSTFTAMTWFQSMAGNPGPPSSHCRLRSPEIRTALTKPLLLRPIKIQSRSSVTVCYLSSKAWNFLENLFILVLELILTIQLWVNMLSLVFS